MVYFENYCVFSVQGQIYRLSNVETNKENDDQSDIKSMKCNIYWKLRNNENKYLKHRTKNNEVNLKICNLLRKDTVHTMKDVGLHIEILK